MHSPLREVVVSEQHSINQQAALVGLIEYAGRKGLLPNLYIKAINSPLRRYKENYPVIWSTRSKANMEERNDGLLSLEKRTTKIIANELRIAAARYRAG